MTENEEFEKICSEAMARLEVGKTELAEEYLEIDPKTLRKYCKEGDIPKAIWSKALHHATGHPEDHFKSVISDLFKNLVSRALKTKSS